MMFQQRISSCLRVPTCFMEPVPAVVNRDTCSAFEMCSASWPIQRFGFARARLPLSGSEMALRRSNYWTF
jgi:hypothetical protein